MKAWLLDRYASSIIVTCTHRALPSMEGPPIEINVEPPASPKVCHTPAPVPLHWKQPMYEDLLRGEALGVIERVPYGKERCVDDTIHYDSDLEQHWWKTIDFLTHVGQAGIVLNPDKFQFAAGSVDFAGFRVSDSTIEPLPKYLNAIRAFPSLTSTTDIRSWFGLVNQVANYAQLRDIMETFKPSSFPDASSHGLPSWRRPLNYLKMSSFVPSVKVWRSSTCIDTPVFAQTSPRVE